MLLFGTQRRSRKLESSVKEILIYSDLNYLIHSMISIKMRQRTQFTEETNILMSKYMYDIHLGHVNKILRIPTKQASLLLAILLSNSKSRAAKLYLQRLVVYRVYTSDFSKGGHADFLGTT